MREHKVDYEGYRLWYDDHVPAEETPFGTVGPFRWEVRKDGREVGTATTFGEAKALVDVVKAKALADKGRVARQD